MGASGSDSSSARQREVMGDEEAGALENGGVCVSRDVSRLECKMVSLSLFETLFQPRFLPQEYIFLSSKMDGVGSGRSSWLHKVEWLSLLTDCCSVRNTRYHARRLGVARS